MFFEGNVENPSANNKRSSQGHGRLGGFSGHIWPDWKSSWFGSWKGYLRNGFSGGPHPAPCTTLMCWGFRWPAGGGPQGGGQGMGSRGAKQEGLGGGSTRGGGVGNSAKAVILRMQSPWFRWEAGQWPDGLWWGVGGSPGWALNAIDPWCDLQGIAPGVSECAHGMLVMIEKRRWLDVSNRGRTSGCVPPSPGFWSSSPPFQATWHFYRTIPWMDLGKTSVRSSQEMSKLPLLSGKET